MKKFELEEQELKVLETLFKHGAMSPGQVSAETWLLPNETLTVLNTLSSEGLILMREDTQSPDGKLVVITTQAREIVQMRTRLQKKWPMTPDGNTPFMAVDAPPVRRISLGWILLLMLVVLLFILLILPAEELALPDWYVLLQTQGQALGLMLAPFFAVGLLGAIVAVAELASTFQTYPREALSTRWAQILVFINVVAAALALIVVQITMPEMNPVLRILSVGVGFQALIRTRFVLAKPIDGNEQGEISLNLGWLYDQFQNLCRNQIDLELMNNRRTAVTQLLDYYPTLAELYDIAWYTIIARATLTPEEEQARLDELEKLLDPKAPEQFARTSIALMILENGGQAYVNLLLSQAAHMADAASGTAVTTDSVLRELLQRPLSEIVALAEQVSDVPEILEWVHKAAIPTPDTTEADQKSAVAHFLVQNVGAKRIAEQLAS